MSVTIHGLLIKKAKNPTSTSSKARGDDYVYYSYYTGSSGFYAVALRFNINGSSVKLVESTKYFSVHLAENFTWSLSTSRKLRKANLLPHILTTFYRGTTESMLRICITAWFGNCTESDRKTLHGIVRTAETIIGVSLPYILDIYTTRCKTTSIVADHTPLTHTPLSCHLERGTEAFRPHIQTV
ncbi:gastrula zinc finger protein XlCGF28.1-like [Silurus meridionalis]|nr:gastrula zinc finger protein XlCGF28.1-like [Silurus meridionalis]